MLVNGSLRTEAAAQPEAQAQRSMVEFELMPKRIFSAGDCRHYNLVDHLYIESVTTSRYVFTWPQHTEDDILYEVQTKRNIHSSYEIIHTNTVFI